MLLSGSNLSEFIVFYLFLDVQKATGAEKNLFTALEFDTVAEKNLYTTLEFATAGEIFLYTALDQSTPWYKKVAKLA